MVSAYRKAGLNSRSFTSIHRLRYSVGLKNPDPTQDLLHLHGTARAVKALQADGILPTRNFRQGNFEHFEAISGQTMSQTILVNRGTCFACVVACKREVEVPELGVTPEYGGPEYETIAANGSLCGVGDLKSIALANKLLAQYVLDSISSGSVIAFAMECYENGLLTKEDTGGIELTFGNEVAVIAMIEKIGKREGIGDLLAEGVKRAAVKIGHGTEHLKPYPDCEFQESFGTSQGRAIHTASFFPKGCAMTGYS